MVDSRSMDVGEVYVELYNRIPPIARAAVHGLTRDQLLERVTPSANPIGWLVWHIARVQDDHIAHVMGDEQLWSRGEWAGGVGLDADPADIGYGHTSHQVAQVRPDTADVLIDYLDAVHARTVGWLATLTATDLDRVVDTRWDPPVTLGVRLVSVADDGLQHAGQAAYLRGLLLEP